MNDPEYTEFEKGERQALTAATPLRGAVRYRSSDGEEHIAEAELGKGIRVPPGATILDFGLRSTYRPGDAPATTISHSIKSLRDPV